jgi:hypothetical protein
MTIPIPEGFVPPEGAEVGSTFEALATLKLGEGTLEVTAIDGLAIGSAEASEAAPNEEMGFDEAVMAGLGTAGEEE